ncbi:hypothetical protein NDU88_002383 [Pleurodeles waltl]|uniref:Uncharacterized protein n=1 Tax=Pleurodeles waltl TaxID=8319 RepID=A0AAV7TKY9_PLEWA|nr:hypothetical protein NDU88_002383 [Pleurodeles waltl]
MLFSVWGLRFPAEKRGAGEDCFWVLTPEWQGREQLALETSSLWQEVAESRVSRAGGPDKTETLRTLAGTSEEEKKCQNCLPRSQPGQEMAGGKPPEADHEKTLEAVSCGVTPSRHSSGGE